MDAIQSFPLEEGLSLSSSFSVSKLDDPSTTPAMALQTLQYHYHSLEVNQREEFKPAVIFLKYMRFIVTRLPDACVDEIWDKILKMTVMYSKSLAKDFADSGKQISRLRRIYASEVPANGFKESEWLGIVLSDYTRCPNPYIRLELFRLIRVFQNDWDNMPWEHISATFIHTISEIQPHRLYPSGDMEEILCGVLDLNYIIEKCIEYGHMGKMILVGFTDKFIHKNNVIVESKEFRFIFHCLQLMGVFVVRTNLFSDSLTQEKQLMSVCSLYFHVKKFLESEDLIYGRTPWTQFIYLVSRPPIRPYIDESIGNITAAIINTKLSHYDKTIMAVVRDIIAWDLDIYSKPGDLPKLLLSRQVHGTVLISKYSLLLRDLRIFYVNSEWYVNGTDNDNVDEINDDYEDSVDESSEDEDNDDEIIHGDDDNLDDEMIEDEFNEEEFNEEEIDEEDDQEN